MHLGNLHAGEHAKVLSIATQGTYRRKLLALGLLPGTKFRVIRVAPLGDPIELRVRGSLISLRKDEANSIEVQTI